MSIAAARWRGGLLVWLLAGYWLWAGAVGLARAADYQPIPEGAGIAIPEPSPAAAANPEIIGTSVEGRPIEAFRFGTGETDLIFVGGIHGGFEWNSAVLAYWFIDYFRLRPDRIPHDLTVHIIPAANPDGLHAVTGKTGRVVSGDVLTDTTSARFNANGVDLNRNWDCEWSADAVWGSRAVSGGEAPFSEPETVALRDYFLRVGPAAVVFWHSAAFAVYASGCDGSYAPSRDLADIYAGASGYLSQRGLTLYKITGDAGNWLATQDIPAVAVELKSRRSLDLARNMAGVAAVLAHYTTDPDWPPTGRLGAENTDRRLFVD